MILAIETSCDETACAIVRGREVLGEAIASQIAIHGPYGGVVPEIASRHHIQALTPVVREALRTAGLSFAHIQAVAVTRGPGLVGALFTGLNFAKGLALSLGKPLIGVHHIEAHISANYIEHEQLAPPFLCLVVSGGHSHLVLVKDYGVHEVLARTRDDAAGEAFDKVARQLGLPYPGGPHLDVLAEQGDENRLVFKRPDAGGDYSFSGLKTGVLQAMKRAEKVGDVLLPQDVAASFRRAVVDQLLGIALPYAQTMGLSAFALAGGVACNALLRREALRRGGEMGLQVVYPSPHYCTDNAAMVGVAGYYRWARGESSPLSIEAKPSLELPV